MRVLVAISQGVDDEDFVFETLSEVFEEHDDGEFVVVHSGGPDSPAQRWAKLAHSYGARAEKADWDNPKADLCMAFYVDAAGDSVTQDRIGKAVLAQIPVRAYTQGL